ncbi:hypothetical protein [Streptomyces sp. NPDC059398]|uniref:hypothetical protein n=1 Tax=Streptomyces sp. NPDC059398 TaxID=3346820 RepID=UPI0036A858DD
METTAAAIIASSVMFSCTAMVLTGLAWFTAVHSRHRQAAIRSSDRTQDELRAELAEVSARVVAIQRLLVDSVE